jgi:hypothetical protein
LNSPASGFLFALWKSKYPFPTLLSPASSTPPYGCLWASHISYNKKINFLASTFSAPQVASFADFSILAKVGSVLFVQAQNPWSHS